MADALGSTDRHDEKGEHEEHEEQEEQGERKGRGERRGRMSRLGSALRSAAAKAWQFAKTPNGRLLASAALFIGGAAVAGSGAVPVGLAMMAVGTAGAWRTVRADRKARQAQQDQQDQQAQSRGADQGSSVRSTRTPARDLSEEAMGHMSTVVERLARAVAGLEEMEARRATAAAEWAAPMRADYGARQDRQDEAHRQSWPAGPDRVPESSRMSIDSDGVGADLKESSRSAPPAGSVRADQSDQSDQLDQSGRAAWQADQGLVGEPSNAPFVSGGVGENRSRFSDDSSAFAQPGVVAAPDELHRAAWGAGSDPVPEPVFRHVGEFNPAVLYQPSGTSSSRASFVQEDSARAASEVPEPVAADVQRYSPTPNFSRPLTPRADASSQTGAVTPEPKRPSSRGRR